MVKVQMTPHLDAYFHAEDVPEPVACAMRRFVRDRVCGHDFLSESDLNSAILGWQEFCRAEIKHQANRLNIRVDPPWNDTRLLVTEGGAIGWFVPGRSRPLEIAIVRGLERPAPSEPPPHQRRLRFADQKGGS